MLNIRCIVAENHSLSRYGKGRRSGPGLSYFLRKDRQSVHWSWVGFHSWVPTMIRSREQ